ncbi:hypothetical protein DFP72DRAFT_68662 [Ephemerocybe angulata]|uniref:Ion transport domain-containing protein n=1 Tax=Ephemerocybe angulata TaxID=980116 RepID=A0A8H6LWB2_9AGAR|nr:hypothetical protein DFP72DRAFT_68662 [Tulosesus angulatus]
METGLVFVFAIKVYREGGLLEFPFYGIIDLLSVLPYYVELMVGQDTSLLLLFSILRMFCLLRVILTIEVMYLSVRRSLPVIGFFFVTMLTVLSTLLYAIPHQLRRRPHPIRLYPRRRMVLYP